MNRKPMNRKPINRKPINRKHVVTLAQAHQRELESLGIKTLELFGSVARDQAHPNSDVDFLVEFTIEPTLFDVFRVQHYLEDLLDCAVDIGTHAALKAHLREPVTKDAVRVF
ncbi:nucleotidyltransferase family protein [Nodosilinea sp. E11]|uniref:nucleotidyltransferase family protein n=1 Tax=Nodosilinea sp. E11 TaxID=3037479 RepID=UPI0029351C43|nr:nucleotidyltransferase family protein [Nodosilinea sp. E11]WOD41720.1 nucleotidyltransferase family protein [Nodosilinea sp. E11]